MREILIAVVLTVLFLSGCDRSTNVVKPSGRQTTLNRELEEELFPLVLPDSFDDAAQLSKDEVAIKLVEFASQSSNDSESFQATLTAARLSLASGDELLARQLFQELSKTTPPSSDLQLQRAVLAFRLGIFDHALEGSILSYEISSDSRSLVIAAVAYDALSDAKPESIRYDILEKGAKARDLLLSSSPELARDLGTNRRDVGRQ